jgi:hypothetical protein
MEKRTVAIIDRPAKKTEEDTRQPVISSMTKLIEFQDRVNRLVLENVWYLIGSTREMLDRTRLPFELWGPVERAVAEGRVAARLDDEASLGHPYAHVVAFLEGKGITVPEPIAEQICRVKHRHEYEKLLTQLNLKVLLPDA